MTLPRLAAPAALLLPSLAGACPACARDTSPSALYLVGAMILLPYVVAAVVLRAVRRGEPGGRP
ncbi:MAG TPA: hypothetical protein VH880_11050 [Anaeromyxobacteraceae bacterium]|jgi:hypothetical protein